MEAEIMMACQRKRASGIAELWSNWKIWRVFDFKFQRKYLHEPLHVEIPG
jgi:hypothetical protein